MACIITDQNCCSFHLYLSIVLPEWLYKNYEKLVVYKYIKNGIRLNHLLAPLHIFACEALYLLKRKEGKVEISKSLLRRFDCLSIEELAVERTVKKE